MIFACLGKGSTRLRRAAVVCSEEGDSVSAVDSGAGGGKFVAVGTRRGWVGETDIKLLRPSPCHRNIVDL